MPNFTGASSPNVVKTALDGVFFQEHDVESSPDYADATTSAIFRQDTADSSAVIWEMFKGVGLWDARPEEADIATDAPRIANQKTFTVSNYAKSIDISNNLFKDGKHSVYEKMVRDFARKARQTRDQNAFAVFRNAFSTATTHDGVALISDSHVAVDGTTIDNNVGAALTETTLGTAIRLLRELKDQAGVVGGSVAKCLLVPPALHKLAHEITQSTLRSGTANNDANFYSDLYGVRVYSSEWLGSAVTGGSNTAWYVLGDNHSVYRFVRQGVITDLVDYKYQRNNNYIYKGEFREVVGAFNFEGLVGSAT